MLQSKKVSVYYDTNDKHKNLLYVYPSKDGRVIKVDVKPNYQKKGLIVNYVNTVFKVTKDNIAGDIKKGSLKKIQ